METLGILHTGKAGKPRVKSIAAMWNFDGDCPHVMTEARIQKKGSHDMVTVSALWDTGASTCAISKELAHEIGLKPTGSTQCDVAGGGHTGGRDGASPLRPARRNGDGDRGGDNRNAGKTVQLHCRNEHNPARRLHHPQDAGRIRLHVQDTEAIKRPARRATDKFKTCFQRKTTNYSSNIKKASFKPYFRIHKATARTTFSTAKMTIWVWQTTAK